MKRPPELVLELLQFVPILSFAVPFMTAGAVDLGSAGSSLLLATAIAALIMGLLRLARHPQNPIHVATNLWLAVGAVAFNAPVPAVSQVYSDWGALTLFGAVLVYGAVQLGTGRGGFLVGVASTKQIRKLTPVMVVLAVAATAWSYAFLDNIRLGGGLPFIALNFARRILLKRTGGGD